MFYGFTDLDLSIVISNFDLLFSFEQVPNIGILGTATPEVIHWTLMEKKRGFKNMSVTGACSESQIFNGAFLVPWDTQQCAYHTLNRVCIVKYL